MYLLAACLMTVAIETAFFALLGYRDRVFLLLCICVNGATNLSLNLLLLLADCLGLTLRWLVYLLEAVVVAAEFLVYGAVRGKSWNLFLLTLAANALSYGVGLLLFGHV